MTSQGDPVHKRRYWMIGAPVTTVRTPPMLEAFFAARGMKAKVTTQHVAADDLPDFMEAVREDAQTDGLLVTMPHKKAAVPLLDRLTEVADGAGSVNAVKRHADGTWIGAQFDGIALVSALRASGVPLDESNILLAGVGGAGLAIAQALQAAGCAALTVTDTNTELLDKVVDGLRSSGQAPVGIAVPSDSAFDVLINATPLGMGEGDPSPFSRRRVVEARFVADIVADPPRTMLADLARARGVQLITGRDMVAAQVTPIGNWLLEADSEQPDH